MATMRYCIHCQDWIAKSAYADHMKQHQHELNLDVQQNKQYHGVRGYKAKEDYMICILHQKKCPCPVKGCNLIPFGCQKKSFMIENARKGYFRTTDRITGQQVNIPIDPETKIVEIMKVPIKLKI